MRKMVRITLQTRRSVSPLRIGLNTCREVLQKRQIQEGNRQDLENKRNLWKENDNNSKEKHLQTSISKQELNWRPDYLKDHFAENSRTFYNFDNFDNSSDGLTTSNMSSLNSNQSASGIQNLSTEDSGASSSLKYSSTSSSSTSISSFIDSDALKNYFSNFDSYDNQQHKRPPYQRVFVNRNLRLEKIQFFGFDMDYTLAEYKSPQMEKMTFELIVDRLISIGYPEEFRAFEYNPIFPVRGLWFDTEYGNLLKVDGFGTILVAVHGFKFLKPCEIEEFYPNKFLHLSDRVYVLNTLFNLPETYLVACVVNFFDKHTSYQSTSDKTGVRNGDVVMSYKSLYQDIRAAVDWVHFGSLMKGRILGNLSEYVHKDERVAQLLTMLRASGRKTFLLTNSDYAYTNGIMTYLLGPEWTSQFDITVVDARKPLWFGEGTVFREVDTKSGALKIGIHAGPLHRGAVYSGGSCDAFRRLVRARGKDVLYVGDHIFGDVLRSKKTRGWRTFLIVPELEQELRVWTGKKSLFERLRELDSMMADLYKDLNNSTSEKPKVDEIVQAIRSVTHTMDQEYGVLGSLFRSGSRTTFFASQVERYADLYASSCYNLVHYPNFYFFRAPMTLMPHESTVDHASQMREPRDSSVGQRVRDWNKSTKTKSYSFEEEDDDVDDALSSSASSAVDGKAEVVTVSGGTSTRTVKSYESSPRKFSSGASSLMGGVGQTINNTAADEKNEGRDGIGHRIADATDTGAHRDVVVPKPSYVDEQR